MYGDGGNRLIRPRRDSYIYFTPESANKVITYFLAQGHTYFGQDGSKRFSLDRVFDEVNGIKSDPAYTARLEEGVHLLEEDESTLRQELAAARKRVADYEKANELLRTQMDQLKENHDPAYVADLEAQLAEAADPRYVEGLEEEVALLKGRLSVLEGSNEGELYPGQVKDLQAEVKRLGKKLKAAREQAKPVVIGYKEGLINIGQYVDDWCTENRLSADITRELAAPFLFSIQGVLYFRPDGKETVEVSYKDFLDHVHILDTEKNREKLDKELREAREI